MAGRLGHSSEPKELKSVICELSSALNKNQEQNENSRKFLKIAQRYTQIPELTTEILHEFIDKILVHAPIKVNGERVVKIDIYYNFVGIIDVASLAA